MLTFATDRIRHAGHARSWTHAMAHARFTFSSLLGCLLLAIAGCSDVSRGSVDTMRLWWHGTPKLSLTAAQVQARPYYQMRASTDLGDAVLILGNIDGRRQYWYGTDNVVVVLQDGRIVQTVGLAQNMDDSRIVGAADPYAAGLHTLKSPSAYERIDDWSPGYRYGVPIHASLSPAGHDEIDILGTKHRVLLVTESIAAPVAHYRTHNRYWVDPDDGFVWMSQQQVLPGLNIKLVQLRPYGKNHP